MSAVAGASQMLQQMQQSNTAAMAGMAARQNKVAAATVTGLLDQAINMARSQPAPGTGQLVDKTA